LVSGKRVRRAPGPTVKMSAGQTLGTARSDVVHPNRYGRALTWRSPGGLSPTTGDHRLAGQTTVQTGGANAYVATSGNAAGAFSLANGQQPWRIIRGDGDFQAVWLPGDGKVYFGGHFGQEIWSGSAKQNVVTASVVASMFISTGQIDRPGRPRSTRPTSAAGRSPRPTRSCGSGATSPVSRSAARTPRSPTWPPTQEIEQYAGWPVRGGGPQGRRTRSPPGRQGRSRSHRLGRRRRAEHPGRPGGRLLRLAPGRSG
jgi:hypothetical protein